MTVNNAAMLRIQALSDKVQFIPGPVNVGLIHIGNSRVVLIDAGLEPAYGQRLFELLRDFRLTLDSILVTHAHADHIGGAAILQKLTGCRILASSREVAAIRFPEVQSIALYGAAPLPEFNNRYLTAEPAYAEPFPTTAELTLGDVRIDIISLAGHSVEQVGYHTDGVTFIADTLFLPRYFQRFGPLFNFDPLQHLDTLESMQSLVSNWFVPGHLPPQQDIKALIRDNMRHINTALDTLHRLLTVPRPPDRLFKEFTGIFKSRKTGWEYFLQQATVRSLLSALKRSGRADYRVLDNLIMWFAVTTPPVSPPIPGPSLATTSGKRR